MSRDRDPDGARKVVIVGAGPVGCLAALALANAACRVDVYEARPDMRVSVPDAAQRSVNLALSSRGLAALYAVDRSLMDRVLEHAIPMRGRMVHTRDGRAESQPYDPHGQCINSIDRRILNQCLLDETAAFPTIRVFFQHKVLAADFDARTLVVRAADAADTDAVRVPFDLCIGADGSYSTVRRQMMRVMRMDFAQEYIPHEYVELRIPARTDAAGATHFRLDPHHLHIWPRHAFMLIALPNKDKSFTCTLFAPTAELARLTTRAAAAAWFAAHFADALRVAGAAALLDDFARNPRGALVSVKARPYHYADRCVLLGDAAHAMVPFYGQGLNCGLEDVRVLASVLGAHGVAGAGLGHALERYSATRHADAVAITELAMDNYVEMRHAVTTAGYGVRKWVDNVFARASGRHVPFSVLAGTLGHAWTGFPARGPWGWLGLYTMVTFRADISYAAAKKKAERQSRIISGLGWAGAGVCVWFAVRMVRWLRRSRSDVILRAIN